MGQAAAHEPTMEEILASIRKIIAEEGSADKKVEPIAEPMTHAAGASGEASQTAKPDTGQISPTHSVQANAMLSTPPTDEQTAITNRPVAPSYHTPTQPEAQMDAPLGQSAGNPASTPASIKDVQAQVAAQLGTSSQQPDPVPEGTFSSKPALANAQNHLASGAASTINAYRETRRDVADHASTTEERPQAAMANSQGNAALDMDEDLIERRAIAGPSPAELEPVRRQDAGAASSFVAEPAREKHAPADDREMEAFRGALMSPSTDESVHSSFERLKRSATDDLDAKTEAILRPMLREWLDENLPTLVERLVREEIERVARGTHR